MAKKATIEGTTETKATSERGIDVEAVTKLVDGLKAKSPENSRILSERLARYVDATDEKTAARESLKGALAFLKG